MPKPEDSYDRDGGLVMTCHARPTRDGMACALCRVQWDRDDSRECVKDDAPLVPEPEPFVSGLAPDLWTIGT